jgi:hypothetical protein
MSTGPTAQLTAGTEVLTGGAMHSPLNSGFVDRVHAVAAILTRARGCMSKSLTATYTTADCAYSQRCTGSSVSIDGQRPPGALPQTLAA